MRSTRSVHPAPIAQHPPTSSAVPMSTRAHPMRPAPMTVMGSTCAMVCCPPMTRLIKIGSRPVVEGRQVPRHSCCPSPRSRTRPISGVPLRDAHACTEFRLVVQLQSEPAACTSLGSPTDARHRIRGAVWARIKPASRCLANRLCDFIPRSMRANMLIVSSPLVLAWGGAQRPAWGSVRHGRAA